MYDGSLLKIVEYVILTTFLILVFWVLFGKLIAWVKRKKYSFASILPTIRIYVSVGIFLSGVYVILPHIPMDPLIKKIFDKSIVFSTIFIVSWAIGVFVEYVLGIYSDIFLRKLPMTALLWSIIRWTILAIGILVGLDAIGIPITPLLTTLGVGGVALALASQDILSNLFAGITMLFAHQIKPGDYVVLDDGTEGFIKDITWRNTVLYAPLRGMNIIVPNSKMASATVRSIPAGSGKYGLIVSVGVSYSTPLQKAFEIVKTVAGQVAKSVPDVNKEIDPVVAYQEFGDSSINISVLFRMYNPAPLARWKVSDTFVKLLKEQFDREGIEIPFSQHDIHIRDINLESMENIFKEGDKGGNH